MTMSRFLHSPGPLRAINNYMFPPGGGVIIPHMEMPGIKFNFLLFFIWNVQPVKIWLPCYLSAKRYKLFPTRSIDAYTAEEIMAWYNDEQLDSDDKIMRRFGKIVC